MAVYSVMAGEESGAGALLAASALAFGFIAWTFERRPDEQPEGRAAGDNGRMQASPQDAVHSTAPAGADDGRPRPSPTNGVSLAVQTGVDTEPITDRGREVLALVAEGYSNKLISGELGIAERTVKNHLTTTMTKLRASDRTHAVVIAHRLGWLDLGQ